MYLFACSLTFTRYLLLYYSAAEPEWSVGDLEICTEGAIQL